jgi:hypothetical protein
MQPAQEDLNFNYLWQTIHKQLNQEDTSQQQARRHAAAQVQAVERAAVQAVAARVEQVALAAHAEAAQDSSVLVLSTTRRSSLSAVLLVWFQEDAA